jgi:hypothetical protein
VLRGVDENELLANAGKDLALTRAVPSAAKILDDSDVAALFGLEMAESADSDTVIPAAPKTAPSFGDVRRPQDVRGENGRGGKEKQTT